MRHLHRAITIALLSVTANLSAQTGLSGGPTAQVDSTSTTIVNSVPLQALSGGSGQPYGSNLNVGKVAWYQAGTEKAAFLGVSGSPLTPALREQMKLPPGVGMVIDFVEPKSPAEVAGLKQYDILQKLDNQLLINAHQLAVLVRMHKSGEEVALTVIHQGQTRQVNVSLVEKEVPALDDRNPWGVPPGPWKNQSGTSVGQGTVGEVGNALGQGTVGGGGSGMMPDDGGATVNVSDDKGSAALHQNKLGKWFIAQDAKGQSLFNGAVDTEEQRKALSPELLEKLKRMESPLHGATERRPRDPFR